MTTQPGRSTASAPFRVAIQKHGVTHVQCTPSMASMLPTDPQGRQALGSVQHLLVGGEALPPCWPRAITDVRGKVINMYGPTETTVWSATYALRGQRRFPIGRPIANTDFTCLTVTVDLSPLVYQGIYWGRRVVRGYLHRPD